MDTNGRGHQSLAKILTFYANHHWLLARDFHIKLHRVRGERSLHLLIILNSFHHHKFETLSVKSYNVLPLGIRVFPFLLFHHC
jgi:hypothetical protein